MSFLEQVLREKEKEISHQMHEKPLDSLVLTIGPEPLRDFHKAIKGGGKIIAEIKQRAPHVKTFRASRIINELAVIYEKNGASALSVVTDTLNFGTSLEDARNFRRETNLPVLVKDFFIDPYQIVAARAFNADAVLLIARILSEKKLSSLLTFTCRLGMKAIVEVHTKEDIEKALSVGAEIIGINNRDLDSLDVNLETTRKLLPEIPDDVLIVSESGINTRRDIESLIDAGVHAFLIGRALLDSSDPGTRLRQLAGKR